MAERGARDPTDLGLLSDADREVLERRHLLTRRTAPSEASRSIGPAEPGSGATAEQVRAHMDAIYADRNWERERLTPEEERAKEERRRRRELQRRG